jgi:hypothetical protein
LDLGVRAQPHSAPVVPERLRDPGCGDETERDEVVRPELGGVAERLALMAGGQGECAVSQVDLDHVVEADHHRDVLADLPSEPNRLVLGGGGRLLSAFEHEPERSRALAR